MPGIGKIAVPASTIINRHFPDLGLIIFLAILTVGAIAIIKHSNSPEGRLERKVSDGVNSLLRSNDRYLLIHRLCNRRFMDTPEFTKDERSNKILMLTLEVTESELRKLNSFRDIHKANYSSRRETIEACMAHRVTQLEYSEFIDMYYKMDAALKGKAS